MQRADLSALSIFAAVAERRNFRAAAQSLGLSPSAVSHAVGALEAKLGVRLLARTTRSVAPTEAGQRLLARLRPALVEIESAIAELDASRNVPAGVLRLTVPRSAAKHLILPRAAAFARAYPDIVLDIHGDESFVDIVAGGFDAGLRFGESIERDMIAIRLGPPQRMIAVAAPTFLADHTPPTHPRHLGQLPCIALRRPGGAIYHWEFEKEGEALEVAITGPLILNDSHLIVDAAIAGSGFAFVFEAMVTSAIARGELVTVLEEWCPPFPGFFLYYPSGRQMRPALRAFIDFYR